MLFTRERSHEMEMPTSFKERGVAATTLDADEKTFRIPFESAGALSFYLRYLLTTQRGPDRKAVLYAHGARLAPAVTIAHRFHRLSWRDDLAANGWDVRALDYVGYGGSDRYAAMAEPPETNSPLCRAEEASRQIERAAEFIVHHGDLPSISIIAHSLGANAAALMMIRRPDLVDRLVMFGPVTHGPGPGGQIPFVPAWQYITVEDWWKTFMADVPLRPLPRHSTDRSRLSLLVPVLAKVPVSQAALYTYTVPVLSAAAACEWLGEQPSLTFFLGAIFMLLGVALAHRSRS